MATTVVVVLVLIVLGIVLPFNKEGNTNNTNGNPNQSNTISVRYRRLISNLSEMNNDPNIPLSVLLESQNLYSFGWVGNVITSAFTMTERDGFLSIGYEMEANEASYSAATNGLTEQKLRWKFPAKQDQNQMTKKIATDLQALMDSL